MLSLFKKYGHFLVFLVLEGLSLYLIINYNHTQKSIFVHSSSRITGSILDQTARLGDYVHLQNENQKLHEENAALIREILTLNQQLNSMKVTNADYDTSHMTVVPARVIKQDILSIRNHLTIDKGKTEGIKPYMGLINNDGIVGIITHVSDRYATAISILNVDAAISASIKSSNYFGSVSWRGRHVKELILTGIPKHATVSPGDTVFTNGYSTIFPPGIPIGIVKEGILDRTDQYFEFFLSSLVDYASLTNVYAVSPRKQREENSPESSE